MKYEDENIDQEYHRGSSYFVSLGAICIKLWLLLYLGDWSYFLGAIITTW